MSRLAPILLLIAFLISIAPAIPLVYAAPIHVTNTKNIDGNAADWSISIPPYNNTWWFNDTNGELIWRDPVNDTYNYLDPYAPGTQGDNRLPYADIVEFHVSGDANYIYFMARFNDTTEITLGQSGATWLSIAIDTTPGSGETYLAGNSETQVDSLAAWERQIVVNLAGKYADGTTPSGTELVAGLQNNWGTFFYLVDNTWSFVSDPDALLAVNLTEGIIEIRISWSALGVTLGGGDVRLNITVMSALGYSNNEGDGGTWDNDVDSDAVDVITGLSATIDEIGDGIINYYLPVIIDGVTGEPKHGSKALVEVGVYPTSIRVGEAYDLWVHVYDELGLPVTGVDVTIKENGVDFATGHTDSYGYMALHGLTKSDSGTYVYTAVTNAYDGYPANTTEASSATLHVLATASKLKVYVNASTVYLGSPIKIYGTLEQNETGVWEPIAGENVSIYINGVFVANATTDSTGYFELNTTAPTYIGTNTIRAYYPGNDTAGYPAVDNTTTLVTIGIRSIDGSPADWAGLIPPRDNMWNVSNNELVWRDAIGDTRTDADSTYENASIVSDITGFRVTVDPYYLYIEITVRDLQELGVAGAPIFDIGIDRDQSGGSGQSWLPGYSDTQAGYYNRWEYAIKLDLSNSAVSGAGSYTGGTGWGDALIVTDSGWSLQDASHAWFGVDNTTETIEIAVPWDIIGGAPGAGDALRFVVISGVGDQSGNFYDIGDSDAIDAVTGYEPNTWDEVGDGYVDYALTVAVNAGFQLAPGDTVSISWISPTPYNESTVPAGVPIDFKVYVRDSLYNRLSHYTVSVFNATSNTKIMDVDLDGLGYGSFQLTLPVGTHELIVVFNGSGLIPAAQSKKLILTAQPIYPTRLNISWGLLDDADGNGYVTPGDTVRVTMTLEYYNSTEDLWHPLPNVNITLNASEAGVLVNVTTDSSGTAVYDWLVTDIGGPNWVKFNATYYGNASAIGTPRFDGSSNATYVPYYIARIVDANLDDWTGTPPATTPGVATSGMEIIINDPAGDVRTDYRSDWDWPHPADLDIVQARLLIDKYELYGAVEYVGNESPYKILLIVIDVEPFNDTGTTWIPGWSDTELATIVGGVSKPVSWDYVVWVNPGQGYVDAYNSSYYHFYNVGGFSYSENGRVVEFYARLSDFGLNGTELAGKQVRIWVLQFAESYGDIWDPGDNGVSTTASDVYDIAGVEGTVGVEVWDNDNNAGNDVWPAQDHWIHFGIGVSIDTGYFPSLSPSATPTSATVVTAPSKLAIGELGNVTVAVSPANMGSYVELKDHDTGEVLWRGITSFDGVAVMGLRYTTKGLHTVDVYVDGNLLASFTVNVTGYLTKLLIDNIQLLDDDANGLPDRVNVTGRLYWFNGTDWLPATGNTTTVKLVYMYYNLTATAINNVPARVLDTAYTVVLGTATVGSDAVFNLVASLSLPSGYPEGGYIVVVDYAGDAQRIPATNNSIAAGGQEFVPLYGSLPGDPFTITGTSPGVYLSSGQLLYVDPTGDYATDYLQGIKIVDLQNLWIGVSGGYLVVKADYDGDLTGVTTASGNSAPFLVIMVDTTPGDTADGVDSFLWLPPGYAFGYSPHTWPYPPYSPLVAGKLVAASGATETRYTHAIIITPVEPSNPKTNYVVWVVEAVDGAILAKPLGVLSASDFANGEFMAYIPLSALGITGAQDLRLWSASGAIYTGGFIYAREIIPGDDQDPATNGKYWHTMVYDVPGTGFLPSTEGENIYAAVYNWSLLLTIDPASGFTTIYTRLVETTVPASVAEGKLYVGPAANHTFAYKLLGSEADLPIIGIDVTLDYNGTTYTATSGADGEVTFQFPVPDAHAGKNATITFTAAAPASLAAAPSYTLRVLYATKIINATMTWTDTNGDGMVSAGDILEFYAKVYVYDETGNWVPKAGINVTFWIYSTPYLLGWNTTDSNGETTFTYPVTGNEGLAGTHNFIVQAGDDQLAGITSTPAEGGTGLTLLMTPTPEPPVMPLLLLAALLLFIIIKKRK